MPIKAKPKTTKRRKMSYKQTLFKTVRILGLVFFYSVLLFLIVTQQEVIIRFLVKFAFLKDSVAAV